jgi:hypothetical protein
MAAPLPPVAARLPHVCLLQSMIDFIATGAILAARRRRQPCESPLNGAEVC